MWPHRSAKGREVDIAKDKEQEGVLYMKKSTVTGGIALPKECLKVKHIRTSCPTSESSWTRPDLDLT